MTLEKKAEVAEALALVRTREWKLDKSYQPGYSIYVEHIRDMILFGYDFSRDLNSQSGQVRIFNDRAAKAAVADSESIFEAISSDGFEVRDFKSQAPPVGGDGWDVAGASQIGSCFESTDL